MSVFGQLSFVPDYFHYEHFLSLYQTEVLITATWYGCLLCFHFWLLCDQMLINCWQHKRCLPTLLFSGRIQAFSLVSYMIQALHCLVEPPECHCCSCTVKSHSTCCPPGLPVLFCKALYGQSVPSLYNYMGLSHLPHARFCICLWLTLGIFVGLLLKIPLNDSPSLHINLSL